MQEFLAWLSRLLDSWKFWLVIAPWEVGVRIRLGKTAAALQPGLHLRIPFVDVVTLVNTRLRFDVTPPVTVAGTRMDRIRYISAIVGYRVDDPVKAMQQFGNATSVVMAKGQGLIAELRDEAAVVKALKEYFGDSTGILVESVALVEDVEARAFRMLNQCTWTNSHESVPPTGAPSARY